MPIAGRSSLDGQTVDADASKSLPTRSLFFSKANPTKFASLRSPDGLLKLQTGLQEFTAEVADPRAWRGRKHGALEAEGRQQVVAPMPGKVVRLLVQAGDKVEAGQGLARRGSDENAKRNSLAQRPALVERLQ